MVVIACGIFQITNIVALWVENCRGVKIADGKMSMPTSVSALAGFCRYDAVEVPADERQERERGDARQAQDHAPLEQARRLDRVVQVEGLESALAEQAEAERTERRERGPDRRDLLQPRERGFHRDGRGVLVLDDLAEHVLLLELPAWRFLHEEGEHRDDHDRDAEDVPGPAPAFGSTGPRRDRGDEDRTGDADAVRAHVHDRRHPGADADRVVVGEQRLMHRDAVRLGDAGPEPRPEEHERVEREARQEDEERRRTTTRCRRSALASLDRRASPSGPRRARRTRPTRCR